MSRTRGFLSRILGRNTDEDETRTYQFEEIGKRVSRSEGFQEEPSQGITVERAAGLIDDLPPEVSRESAVRIMRGTLLAAGVEVQDIEKSAQVRETRLDSEIEFAQNRQEDLRKRTEEVVRSLQEEIRKAREARDAGIAEEEENISRAVRGLEEVRRVRAFFDFTEKTGETTDSGVDPSKDETQVLDLDEATTRAIRSSDSPNKADEPAPGGPSTYGTTEER